jgi:hypothetical protein
MYFLNHFMLTLKHSLILLALTLATDNGLRIPIRGYELPFETGKGWISSCYESL